VVETDGDEVVKVRGDPGDLDPVTGMVRYSGVPVTLRRPRAVP
jgi:hypothetical protein